MEYLNGYLAILPEDQRNEIIKKIIVDNIGSNSEYKQLLINKLNNFGNEPLTEYEEQTGRIDADLYNKIVSSIFGDLNILFSESEIINNAIISHHHSNISTLSELKQEIKKLKERIQSISIISDSNDSLITTHEKFSDLSNVETRFEYANLFTDRNGQTLFEDAIIDPQAGNLMLNSISENDRIVDGSGNSIAQINIIQQTAIGNAPQSQHPISCIIDGSVETYWAQLSLTNEPLNVTIDNYSAGAMAKFEIVLPNAVLVNQISLTPFTCYPLDICKIEYYSDDGTYSVPSILISDDSITQKKIYQFDTRPIKKIIFLIRQKNFVVNSYLVPKKEVNDTDLWETIFNKESEVSYEGRNLESNPTVTQSYINNISGWAAYSAVLEEYMKQYQAWQKSVNEYNATYLSLYNQYVADLLAYNQKYGTNHEPVLWAPGGNNI